MREAGTNLPICIEGANTQNAGKRLVNGMDITAAYQLPWTHFGTFTFSLGYNYFFTWKAEPVEGAGTNNFLGDYNNGTLPLAPGAIPYHKGFLRGEWEWRGLRLRCHDELHQLVQRRSGVCRDDERPERNPPCDRLHHARYAAELRVREAGSRASGRHQGFSKDGKSAVSQVAGVEDNGRFFQRMLWGTKLRVGVVNAFDRRPPTVLGAFNDNYDTSLYSIRNRYWYVGINKKF